MGGLKKTYIDADTVNVTVENGCHLSLLNIRDFPLRKHDKAIDILLPSQTV